MSGLINPAEADFAAVATFVTIARRVDVANDATATTEKSLTTAKSIIQALIGNQRYDRRQYFYYDSTEQDDRSMFETEIMQGKLSQAHPDVASVMMDNLLGCETDQNDFPRAIHLNLIGKPPQSAQNHVMEIPFYKTRKKVLDLLTRTGNDPDTSISSVVVVSHPRFSLVHGETLPKIFGAAMDGVDGLDVQQYQPQEHSVKKALADNIKLMRALV